LRKVTIACLPQLGPELLEAGARVDIKKERKKKVTIVFTTKLQKVQKLQVTENKVTV